MSLVHVMEGTRCVLHGSVPDGKNSVNVPWKAAFLAAGVSGSTAMTVGTEPGQITETEAAAIKAGDLFEMSAELPLSSCGHVQKAIKQMARTCLADRVKAEQARLAWFGLAIGDEA